MSRPTKEAAPAYVSVAQLVAIILDDLARSSRTGRPKKYLNTDEHLVTDRPVFDLLMPNGKKLGDCTVDEVRALAEAYSVVASGTAA